LYIAEVKPLFKKIYAAWKRFARLLGRVQLAIILTLFYLIVFVPLGLVCHLARLFPGRQIKSTWRPYRTISNPREYFRRQG
jgi:hypothetical protein